MRSRILLIVALVAFFGTLASAWVARAVSSLWLAVGGAILVALAIVGTLWVLFRRDLSSLDRVSEGLRKLAQREWTGEHGDAMGTLGPLVVGLNELADVLRTEEKNHEQREALLRTIVDAAPMAIVLLDSPGKIVYSNETARELFFEGESQEGQNFLAMLDAAPPPFREALLGNEDVLFSVDAAEEPETYHLAKCHFQLQGEEHVLIMVKHLTRELRRQEVDVWKKLIRVISHELNNSLAPITSLVHSARLITSGKESSPRLGQVFDTIEERAKHLQTFVEGYASFARLPKPRRQLVDLPTFASHIRELTPFAKVEDTPPMHGSFDQSQIEQVIINLLKNAKEAEGPPDSIELSFRKGEGQGLEVVVTDRGTGMSDEVLQSALLPFYSTKERGTGLGLALSREILEAHGGKIRIENRDEGGLKVTCWLPGPEAVMPAVRTRLTLSRSSIG